MAEQRSARPQDFETMMAFLSEAYAVAPDFFATHYAHVWGEANIDWEHTYLMVEADRILSLVRVFPLDLWQGGIRVQIGGIGGVSTLPAARGQGYMTRLLHHAIARMEAEGFPISILWGDRHRYSAFGWERAGKCLNLTLTRRSLERCGIETITPEEYTGQPERLSLIASAYDRNAYCSVRSLQESKLIFTRPELALYCAGEEDRFGYLAISPGWGGETMVAEFGGNPTTVLGLTRACMEQRDLNSLPFAFPTRETIPPPIMEAASYWTVTPQSMIRILDLDKTLAVFRQQEGAGPCPDVATLRGLSPQEQVQTLFGTLSDSPFHVFVWPLDWI